MNSRELLDQQRKSGATGWATWKEIACTLADEIAELKDGPHPASREDTISYLLETASTLTSAAKALIDMGDPEPVARPVTGENQ